MNDDSKGPGERYYVRHISRYPAHSWATGLDAGQRRDHTAIAMVETTWTYIHQDPVSYAHVFVPQLTIRGFERVPLHTSYEDIYDIVKDKLQVLDRQSPYRPFGKPPKSELVIDAGGPGAPIVDCFRRILPRDVRVTPVIITAGHLEGSPGRGYKTVPRRSLLTLLTQNIHFKLVKCPANLPGFEQFTEELLDIEGQSTQPSSSRSHDDLVMAAALAVWAAMRDVDELKPGSRYKGQTGGLSF